MQMHAQVIIKGPVAERRAPAIAHKEILAAMSEAVMFLERKVKENIERAGRMGVGGSQTGLYRTIAGEVIDKGAAMVKGIVSHSKPHGDVIELGRRPGKKMPPPGVLLEWIKLRIGATGETAKQIEFLIRRKIARKGFPGIHMFQKAFEDNYSQVRAIFARHGYEIAKLVSDCNERHRPEIGHQGSPGGNSWDWNRASV